MKIFAGQQLSQTRLYPVFLLCISAVGTMAVAATVVLHLFMSAVLVGATVEMIAQGMCSALSDGVENGKGTRSAR